MSSEQQQGEAQSRRGASDGSVKFPNCPKCGNNRQVWRNQITGRLTCHRAYCHTEIEEPNTQAQRPAGEAAAKETENG